MTGPKGNSAFCFHETLNVPRGEANYQLKNISRRLVLPHEANETQALNTFLWKPWLAYNSYEIKARRIFRPGARFSKAPETFRPRKDIFSSSISKNEEVYAPETSFLKRTSVHIKNIQNIQKVIWDHSLASKKQASCVYSSN